MPVYVEFRLGKDDNIFRSENLVESGSFGVYGLPDSSTEVVIYYSDESQKREYTKLFPDGFDELFKYRRDIFFNFQSRRDENKKEFLERSHQYPASLIFNSNAAKVLGNIVPESTDFNRNIALAFERALKDFRDGCEYVEWRVGVLSHNSYRGKEIFLNPTKRLGPYTRERYWLTVCHKPSYTEAVMFIGLDEPDCIKYENGKDAAPLRCEPVNKLIPSIPWSVLNVKGVVDAYACSVTDELLRLLPDPAKYLNKNYRLHTGPRPKN